MELIRTIVLAVLQGLTEFLPISSSGHLILVPAVFGWGDQGLAFDIAVHFGTLFAVMFYLRRELLEMLRAIRDPRSRSGRLAWQVVAASVPVGLCGLAFADLIEANLRTPLIIAATTAGFGVLLWLADRLGRGARDEHELSWLLALTVGLAQTLALVPGTSRSGVTMTAALALGLSRKAASRFAFLLAIPAIAMAAGWQTLELLGDPSPVAWGQLVLATLVAAVTAFAALAAFMRVIERIGMTWFMAYRLVLGIVIVYVFV